MVIQKLPVVGSGFMKRFLGGLRTLVHGLFSFDLRAWGAILLGGVFFYFVQMPLSVVFGLFVNNYETAEPLILLSSFLCAVPIIDVAYEKMGGKKDSKDEVKED
jgi:hypothetical protein